MELNFKLSTNKNEIEHIDTSFPFEESIGEDEKYVFNFDLDVYQEENKVAKIYGYILDEDKILNDNQDIIDIADMYGGDFPNAISTLVYSGTYEEELADDFITTPKFLCYIERFYVYPECRQKGIGSFLINNLDQILLYSLNVHIRCFVIYPKPQIPVGDNWEDLEDKNGMIKKTLVKVIKNAGYKQIDKAGYYAVNCMNLNLNQK